MISILSVNRNCVDWMRLLIQSVKKFTTVPYEIVIVDNDSKDDSVAWLKSRWDVKAVMLNTNIGHGAGLDLGLKHVSNRFCLVLDIDAHIMRRHWDYDLLDVYNSNGDIRLIAAKGGEAKPVHPCVMFFEAEFFREHNLSFIPADGYDVGRKIYPDILDLGYKVSMLHVGYEKPKTKYYEGVWGDVYYLNQQPLAYHNWYSARMWNKDRVDDLTKEEFERRKAILFSHPHVKEILGHPKSIEH